MDKIENEMKNENLDKFILALNMPPIFKKWKKNWKIICEVWMWLPLFLYPKPLLGPYEPPKGLKPKTLKRLPKTRQWQWNFDSSHHQFFFSLFLLFFPSSFPFLLVILLFLSFFSLLLYLQWRWRTWWGTPLLTFFLLSSWSQNCAANNDNDQGTEDANFSLMNRCWNLND